MRTKAHPRRRGSRKGAIITQAVIFGGTVGVGMAALAIDTGLMYAAKQELQSTADSAALAAASQLGSASDPLQRARVEAGVFASLNKVAGEHSQVVESDMVFGHAALNGTKYEFSANAEPCNAVQVRIRRDQTVSDGPVSLVFGKALGLNSAEIRAAATAMLMPRDISVVIDLSGSMNDDSEVQNNNDVQVNLEDVWLALPCEKGNNGVGNGIDPQPPGNPGNHNDQPGTGPGSPNSQGGNPSPGADPTGPGGCTGPRWGWMTGFGNEVVHGSYTPVGDPGLYHIPRYQTCTEADIVENLTTSGYSAEERTALLSGSYDSDTTNYSNRVRVLLGLAGWRSKKKDGKFSGGPGNKDNVVDTKELIQEANWPFSAGSWADYVLYVSAPDNRMTSTDANWRYRFGIKTVVNYLLEKQAGHTKCPELVSAPEMPLHSVKQSVQTLIDTILESEADDHCSLEVFATTGRHEVDLASPETGQSLAEVLQAVPSTLSQRQVAHYDNSTCIGCGFDLAMNELKGPRSRPLVAKVVILLTDGLPNVSANGSNPTEYAEEKAEEAAEAGITIYTIGVGSGVDSAFLQQLAQKGRGEYYFADASPDPSTGQPMYMTQLPEIFRTLASDKRPVRLIK